VLLWLARGKANKEISDILLISPRTVNKHLERVFAKLGVENRASATSVAMRALAARA
jgi:DNA-binding CsgD family transcriptional regulator